MSAVARYCDLWHLEPEGLPFETPSSVLLYVRCKDAPAVLKLPKPASDEHRSGLALLHYDGNASVRVLAYDGGVFLMERALPGDTLESLAQFGRDDEATHVLCDTIEQLHRRALPPGDWKTLDDLARGFVRYRVGPQHTLLEADLVNRAEATFLDLCATQASERYLLHGDLHHMNVLRDENRGWLAIDPKGIAGELAYEVVTALHNPLPLYEMMADPDVMSRRVRIFADRLGLTEERILRWCFAADILHHLWVIEDGMDTSDFSKSLSVAKTAEHLFGKSP